MDYGKSIFQKFDLNFTDNLMNIMHIFALCSSSDFIYGKSINISEFKN